MSATANDQRLRGKTRWSMAARCPRMAAYGLLGEQPEEPDEQTQLRWARGKLDETWFIEHVLAAKVGLENIIREKAVPWPSDGLPAGELHEDAFVTTQAMPYEVKSHADGDLMDSDYLQLKGALRHDPDVTGDPKTGALVVIDRDLKWEAVPVFLTDDDVEEIDSIAAQVIEAGKTGQLPERVCEKPADARGRLCPFAAKCFHDWVPPDPERLNSDVAMLAIDLRHAQERAKELKAELAPVEERRKEIAALLAEWDLQPGIEYVGAGVKVKLTRISDTERLSLTQIRKAGAWTPELADALGEYVTASGGHDRWTVKPDAESSGDVDFGETPF